MPLEDNYQAHQKKTKLNITKKEEGIKFMPSQYTNA